MTTIAFRHFESSRTLLYQAQIVRPYKVGIAPRVPFQSSSCKFKNCYLTYRRCRDVSSELQRIEEANLQTPMDDGGAEPADVAPWYQVARRNVVTVEHPCIVKNVDKGIAMLGGSQGLLAALEDDPNQSVAIRFRPQDPFSRSITSTTVASNNVLLKITVPRRTGRKRKRGSDEAYVTSERAEPRRDSDYLLQSLRDNKQRYDVEALGTITRTELFRSIPDFQYSTTQSSFMNEFKNKIMPQEFPKLKDWHFNQTYGLENTEIIPPPVFSTHTFPHNYSYRQNPNTSNRAKVFTIQVKWDTPVYPNAPPPQANALEKESHNMQGMVRMLKMLFERRPIWTFRGLLNQLPPKAPFFLVKYAMGYVAFALRSGPWRETYCKFGIDPRSDSLYRTYQSVLLQLWPSDAQGKSETAPEYRRNFARSEDQRSHIFTGTAPMPSDGKCWQLCDLEDPLLKELATINDLEMRSVCDQRYFGWFPNGRMAKIRIILKQKIDYLMKDRVIDDSIFDRLLSWPDNVTSQSADGDFFMPRGSSREEFVWASFYRSTVRTEEGALPAPNRIGKAKRFRNGHNTDQQDVATDDEDMDGLENEDDNDADQDQERLSDEQAEDDGRLDEEAMYDLEMRT